MTRVVSFLELNRVRAFGENAILLSIMKRDRNSASLPFDRGVSSCDYKGSFSSRARGCVLLGLILLLFLFLII